MRPDRKKPVSISSSLSFSGTFTFFFSWINLGAIRRCIGLGDRPLARPAKAPTAFHWDRLDHGAIEFWGCRVDSLGTEERKKNEIKTVRTEPKPIPSRSSFLLPVFFPSRRREFSNRIQPVDDSGKSSFIRSFDFKGMPAEMLRILEAHRTFAQRPLLSVGPSAIFLGKRWF